MKYLDVKDPIRKFVEILGGKWRLLIIDHLIIGKQRFNELESSIEGISPRMLAKEIKALTNCGIVEKNVFKELPPRVEYNLTDYGIKLYPLLETIKKVGENHFVFEQDPDSIVLKEDIIVNENEIPIEDLVQKKKNALKQLEVTVEKSKPDKIKKEKVVEKKVKKPEEPIQQLSLF